MSEQDDPNALTKYEQRKVDLETPLDQRQLARLGDGATVGSVKAFDPRLAYELALQMDTAANVFAKYGLAGDDAIRLMQLPAFVGTIKRYRDEIAESGIGFKLKARVMAEDLLEHGYDLASDPETPPSVRADLIKWMAAVAGLGPPKDTKGEGGATAGAEFRLNITFAGAGPAAVAQRHTIDVVPTTKEITA